ncbi:ATP-binding protein [Phytohabitans sp. LJ34]|uniref:ATP-binding protein n=1 Tax=Phytohabitans sp. LJ34 TaxID=3452217 RepID=UPI003F8A350E
MAVATQSHTRTGPPEPYLASEGQPVSVPKSIWQYAALPLSEQATNDDRWSAIAPEIRRRPRENTNRWRVGWPAWTRPQHKSSPLVGRESLLFELHRALRETARGAGGCVVLEGAAGIGKSRLLEAAAEAAGAAGVTVAAARAIELHFAAPLTTMRSLLQSVAPSGLDISGIDEADQNPQWWIDRIGERIEHYVRSRSLLVVLDDAHWADELTALALRILVPELSSSPVLWLLSRRPAPTRGYAQEAIDWLISEGATRHELRPLEDDAVFELCTTLLGATPDASVLATAHRSGGNPFLLEQLLTTLCSAGQVRVTGGTATLVGDELTDDFLTAVDQRLRDLSEPARRLLDAGAVLGRPFSVHEVAGLLEQSAIELLPTVQEAVSAAILVDDGAELAFRHDLIREARYNRLPGPVRRALHREAASVVQQEGRSPVEVVEHLVRAGGHNDALAVSVLRQAMTQIAPTAPNTAADLILRTLDLISEHDPARPRLIADAVRLLALAGRVVEATRLGEGALHAGLEPDDELELLLGLAEAANVMGHSAEVVQYTSRAIARVAETDPIRAELLAIQAFALLDDMNDAAADEAGAAAAALGASTGEYAALVCGISARSVGARMRGDLEAAVSLGSDAVRITDRVGGESRRRHPRLWLAAALTAVDQFEEADAALVADQREADRLGTTWAQPRWYHHRTTLRIAAGRLDDAVTEAETGIRVTEQLCAPAKSLPLLTILAQLAIQRDDIAAATEYLRRARQIVADGHTAGADDVAWTDAQLREAVGEPPAEALRSIAPLASDARLRTALLTRDPTAGPRVARMAIAGGDLELAEAMSTTARQIADRNSGVPSLAGTAAHTEGLLHRDIDSLRAAVDAFRTGPRPLATAAGLEDLAMLEGGAGHRSTAVELMKQALRLYADCGAKRDAARAQRGMRALGVRFRMRPGSVGRNSGWESLTESELRVVRLVAEGLTNREVAEHLFLSPHTVDSHLRHSFAKLGVKSRVELARRVLIRDGRAS